MTPPPAMTEDEALKAAIAASNATTQPTDEFKSCTSCNSPLKKMFDLPAGYPRAGGIECDKCDKKISLSEGFWHCSSSQCESDFHLRCV